MAPTMWGIHNDSLTDELVRGGFISLGWDEVGDLRKLGGTRESIKRHLISQFPGENPNRIPGRAGVLYRFAHVMKPGDVVIAPYKPDSTINIGIVDGDYYHAAEEPRHRHRRPVRWEKVGLPRAVFSQSALYELGSAITLFEFKRHSDEVLAVLNAGSEDADDIAKVVDTVVAPSGEEVEEEEFEQPRASRILRHTRDFVLECISTRISPYEFEELAADLLRTIGYQARVTQFSQDGGIDVVAHKDPLGVEPPQIKAQCKQRVSTIGSPDVQQLVGTLGHGDLGLFITLGTYSKDAYAIERQRPGLRLLTGEDVVTLIIDNYALLPERWRKLIPLTTVLVVADEAI